VKPPAVTTVFVKCLTVISRKFDLEISSKQRVKVMRQKYIRTLFLIGCLLITGILTAQEIPGRKNEGVKQAGPTNIKRDAYNGLDLTKEQQKQLRELEKDNRQALKDIQADNSLTAAEKKDQLRAVRQQQVEKRKGILTRAQNARYEENIREFRKNSSEAATDKNVVNNIIKDKEKDANGLSRDHGKKTSKKNSASWNNLNLSSEQKEQMKLWNDDYTSRLKIIKYDLSLKGEQKQSQIEQLVREQDLQLRSILTPEQKLIWDERLRQQKMRSTPQEIRNNPRLYYLK
jgi:Spy/CpxP family protein refolding chaperone